MLKTEKNTPFAAFTLHAFNLYTHVANGFVDIVRQMMTNIMRNMGSPGPGYETLQPTQTAQPNPQTPSPQPTQPTTTPTPQRQSYLQTRHHRQKPKPQPRQFTLYDWIRANQILNPEFDITEMFGGA